MNLLNIYKKLKTDMQFIERELYKSVHSPDPLMTEASSHLLKAGGKRIRPIFVLLGGKSGNYDINRLKYIAVALELVHMSSLVHDDVVDDADIRRGQLTVKSKWDNRVAMYTGNYILSQAVGYISKLENVRIHQILSKAIVNMCIGEIEQIKCLYEWNQSLKTYLLRIKRKTALLMAISCQLGALACGAKEDIVQALYRYGYNVGMAFQITDDILDLTGTEQQLGKPAGNDLLQGNITLPVLLSMENASVKNHIIQEFNSGHPDIKHIIDLVLNSGGIHRAKEIAQKYLHKARESLNHLHDHDSKDIFSQIARFIEQRTF